MIPLQSYLRRARLGAALGLAMLTGLAGACAPRAATSPTSPAPAPAPAPDPDAELLAARESAWRAYFAGDVATLRALLPPSFIGLDMGPGPFVDLAETLAGAASFRARGGRLVRLAFPETRAQRHGDVVVLYGRFEVVLAIDGAEKTLRGRLTEVFVRRDGRWIHPGWHLDLVDAPAPTLASDDASTRPAAME